MSEKPNAKVKRINWPQVVAEVGLLFLGVGLALLANSMWDARQDRIAEREYLESMSGDLVATEMELARLEGRINSIITGNQRILNHVNGEQAITDSDSLSGLILKSFSLDYFRPVLGTYSDMLGSGSLSLIQDSRIREGMANVVEETGVLNYSIQTLLARWTTLEEPFIIQNLPADLIYDGYPQDLLPELEQRIGRLDIPNRGGDVAVPRSQEYRNMISMRMVLLQDVLIQIELLRDKIGPVQELIDSTLE